jgi:hypothetical protein
MVPLLHCQAITPWHKMAENGTLFIRHIINLLFECNNSTHRWLRVAHTVSHGRSTVPLCHRRQLPRPSATPLSAILVQGWQRGIRTPSPLACRPLDIIG